MRARPFHWRRALDKATGAPVGNTTTVGAVVVGKPMSNGTETPVGLAGGNNTKLGSTTTAAEPLTSLLALTAGRSSSGAGGRRALDE